jgi:hypothetical protein
MLEKETADLITFVLIAGIGIELLIIIGLEIWRRMYLQRFTPSSVRSRSAVRASHQSPTGSLRDTSAAPLHQQKTDSTRKQRDKK